MGMREKLIELLFECQNECYSITCDECEHFGKWRCLSQWQADSLIANGVTIPRWIPVTDRLPDKDGEYLVCWVDKGVFNAEYESKHGIFEANVERTFEGVKKWLEVNECEGLVFWLDGEPVCKIKRSDFGLEWPVK